MWGHGKMVVLGFRTVRFAGEVGAEDLAAVADVRCMRRMNLAGSCTAASAVAWWF